MNRRLPEYRARQRRDGSSHGPARVSTLIATFLIALVGCGSSGDDGETNSPIFGTTADGQLEIAFSPAYSAFDGVHTFQIPAIVKTSVTGVKWSITPSSAADLDVDANGGVMLTIKQAGDAMLTATAGKLSGQAPLHVTAATPDQWETGNKRYHNDVKIDLTMMPDGGMPMMGPPSIMIPTNAACVNCHGEGASMLHIEHTPQQIGGYSDDDLKMIFKTGTKPAGSPFHSVIPPFFYRMFHTWATADDSEAQSLVVYLRSLTPKSQGNIDYPRPPGRP